MKYLLPTLLGLVLLLSGCAARYKSIPSTEHCTNVSYERIGRDIRIEADCIAPPAGADGLMDIVT